MQMTTSDEHSIIPVHYAAHVLHVCSQPIPLKEILPF